MFPSPHSGILFYGGGRIVEHTCCNSFRPLIRGFFFMRRITSASRSLISRSFRPLIRGFFFMSSYGQHDEVCRYVSVPSFGDSFLSCRYDMPPSLNIFAIFRRILHLLAQKGFPLTQSIHFSPYPSASARIKSFFHPYCTVSNSS